MTTIEIKTNTMEPVRKSFSHLQQRFGDKPATRYQEASYDVQVTSNFQYRPHWEPDKELNDPSRTGIVMQDWYAFRDPRQYYYGTYVQARAKMQDAAEHDYAFFEKRNLVDNQPESVIAKVIHLMVPLRHYEMGANLNNTNSAALAYGTVLAQAHIYCGMDRLGLAQYLSRIGLLLDRNSGVALKEAKDFWLNDPIWQGLRRYTEDTMVMKDWLELSIAQNLIMDGLLYPLIYEVLDQQLGAEGGRDISMLTDFMREWFSENQKWIDSMVKAAASESDANKALLKQWAEHWTTRALEALKPLAEAMDSTIALSDIASDLKTRIQKIGVN